MRWRIVRLRSHSMRVGILTGGGDCPGLNAVIRAIVRKGERHYGDQLFGFLDGWRGVMDADYHGTGRPGLRGTLPRGGTIIGTSRIQPFMYEDGLDRVKGTIADMELDAIVAIGGEGTLSCSAELFRRGLPIVGCPRPSTTTLV